MALSRRVLRGRRKFFFSIKGWDYGVAGRCIYCYEPIMMVKKPFKSGRGVRRVPIEIRHGWDGSTWYKKGIHKYHGFSCPEVRKRVMNPDEEDV